MGMPNTRLGAVKAARLLSGVDSLYMVGIGGVGMSPLARLARARGFRVSGEDTAEGEAVRALTCAGIRVTRKFSDLPCGKVAVVYSAAIPSDHPALRSGAPLLSRADLLAAMMQDSNERVTVAGMHGKTSVTAMLDHILHRAGLSPTTVSGGSLTTGDSLRIGENGIFIAEACEYADSFLSLSPTVAIALNLEHEHPDYFPTLADAEYSFAAYLQSAARAVVLPSGDARLASLASDRAKIYRFGGKELAAYERKPSETGERFLLRPEGEAEIPVHLPAIGAHAVINALAAMRTAKLFGVPYAFAAEALGDLRPSRRRLELRAKRCGALWYDDYAHHPSELNASVSALRERTTGRLICVFQPHTYSRTRAFFEEFASALSAADLVLLLPIYSARELDTLGVASEQLVARIGEKAAAARDIGAAAEYLLSEVREGDTVLIAGAGDGNRIFDLI